jgi:hypothetical protein
MMKTVYVWDPAPYGIPKNYNEAQKTYQSLLKNGVGHSTDKINQFGEKVAAWLQTNPLITHVMQDCLYFMVEDIQQKPSEVVEIDLSRDDTTEKLRQIVRFAQMCDLVVAYDEFGMVFLPDGRVIPENGADMWEAVTHLLDAPNPAFPPSLTQFYQLLDSRMAVMAERHGMHKTKLFFWRDHNAYMRTFEGGDQYLSYHLRGDLDEYIVEFNLYLNHKQTVDIYNQFNFIKRNYVDKLRVVGSLNRKYYFQFQKVVGKYGQITNHQELNAALVLFEHFIFKVILDVATNIKGLDYLINGEGEDHILYAPNHNEKKNFNSPLSLIVARLAGNPNFEELVIKRESEKDWGINQTARETEWPKLLKYLREEVKPIV